MKSTNQIHILTETNSALSHFISEIRDAEVQSDSLRFRQNLVRIGEIFAYEISKTLEYREKEVTTSLGIANSAVIENFPVLATILRAGLPFHQGFLNIFDRSENAFISAYRKTHKDGTFRVNLEYASIPEIENKTVILCDTMMATGSSIVCAYKELIAKGKPVRMHFATILTSMEGLNYLKMNVPKKDVDIWIGAVDEELTAQAYLVPGLGDAGDLAFGKKL
jgi:uracil phosphoribosyltransferase